MIEKLVPLQIPPGIVKNGTMYERAGRWMDGNLVRFWNNDVRAIGGWSTLTITTGPSGASQPTGAFGWYDGTDYYIAVANSSGSKLWLIKQNGLLTGQGTDITGAIGISSAGAWFDTLDPNTLLILGGPSTIIFQSVNHATAVTTGSPAFNTFLVTPEKFVMGVTSTNNIKWASQGSTTVWTPTSLNSAGGIDIVSSGVARTMRRVRGQTLLWTSQDLWSINYVGAPLYYGVTPIASGCGAVSIRSVAVVGNNEAFWMSDRGFFTYNGFVQRLPCDLEDDIYADFNGAWVSRIWSFVNAPYNEVWWFYPSSGANGSTGPDRYVSYNYVDKVWSRGTLSRSAGCDTGFWDAQNLGFTLRTNPVMFDINGTTVYVHETATAPTGAYIESGPMLGDAGGSKILRVQKMIMDNSQTAATEFVYLFMGNYPKEAESSWSTAIPTTTGEVDFRSTGRYLRFRQDLTRADSRIGTPRAGIIVEGSR